MKPPPNHSAGAHFRDADEQWIIDAGDAPLEVATAWLQFRLARVVWGEVGHGRLTVDQIAQQLGQSFEAQRKKLAGEQPASLRDLVGWVMLLGDAGYEALPRGDSSLLPPTAAPHLRGWRSGSGTLPTFQSTPTPDWPQLAASLSRDLSDAQTEARAHLITADWMRQRSIEHLLAEGTAPDQLRLLAVSSAAAFQIGVLTPVVVAVDLVGLDEAADAARARAAAWRLRANVQELATQASDRVLIVGALGEMGVAVAKEAISPGGIEDPEFSIGPFEADGASGASWWSSHEVSLRRLAWEVDGGLVAAFAIQKISPI